jgi:hypothetical protein
MADTRIDKGVNIHDFHSWLHHRDRQQQGHVPAADLVVPLVAQAGRRGMTRGEVGKAVGDDLDRDALDDLLAGLVEFGLLAVTRENGLLVFRAGGNFPSRLPSLKV